MSFNVVQIKKPINTIPVIEIVPNKWVLGSHVFWPPNNWVTHSQDPNSIPDVATWKPFPCILIGENLSFAEAEKLAEHHLTNSYDNLSRSTPKSSTKKQTFERIQMQNEEVSSNFRPSPQDPLNPEYEEEDEGQVLEYKCDLIDLDESEQNNLETDQSADEGRVSVDKTYESIILDRIQRLDDKLEFQFNILQDQQEALNQSVQQFMNKLVKIEKRFKEQVLDSGLDLLKEQPHRIAEDFSYFETMARMKTPEELYAFEETLADENMQSKLVRYYSKLKKLNGKADGKAVMVDILRLFIDPIALQGYSWKGQRASTCRVNKELKSFKLSFPNIIKSFHKIACAADITITKEDSDNSVSEYLRLKYCNMKRDAQRVSGCRSSFKRRRYRSTKVDIEVEVDDS